MKLIWHIVWKDARRLRWALAGWAGLIVAQLLIGAAMIVAWRNVDSDPTLALVWQLSRTATILQWLQFISVYLMVAALVHNDPLVGTRARWMTLPISGRRLLAAKLATIALFLWLLPCVLTLPWWLANGFGGREIAAAAAQIVLQHAAVTLAALPVAMLTDNWTRFLTWTLVQMGAVGCCAITFGAMVQPDSAGVLQQEAKKLAGSRALLAAVVWLVAIAVMIVHQFLTRRTARTVSFAAISAGGALAIMIAWPIDLTPAIRAIAGQTTKEHGPLPRYTAELTLSAPMDAPFVSLLPKGSTGDAWLWFGLEARADDLNARERLSYVDVEAEWRWPDGTSLQRRFWFDASLSLYSGASAVVLADPLDASRRAVPVQLRLSRQVFIPASFAARMLAQPPTFRATVRAMVYRGEVTDEIPISRGTRFGRDPRRLTILDWKRDGVGTAFSMTVLETEPASLGFFSSASGGGWLASGYWGQYGVATVNRSTGAQAVRSASGHGWPLAFAQVGGVAIRWWKVALFPPRIRNPEWKGSSSQELWARFDRNLMNKMFLPADPHWFDEAKLVNVAFTPVGRLETTFTIERFEVKEGKRQGSP